MRIMMYGYSLIMAKAQFADNRVYIYSDKPSPELLCNISEGMFDKLVDKSYIVIDNPGVDNYLNSLYNVISQMTGIR